MYNRNLQTPRTEIEQLRDRYEARLEGLPGPGQQIVGVASNTVPWEVVSAAGFTPVLLSSRRAPAPLAEPYMEEGFDGRTRAVFDHLLSGDWNFLRTVVIPRTSEQEHKLFLYLSEVARQEPARKLPQVLLFNLLHTRSPEARAYGLARTRDLLQTLGGASDERLLQTIAEGNAARNAVRSLLKLRTDRLSGADAMTLIGAFYFMDRAEYARLAGAAAKAISLRRPISGPRIMIKGSILDHPHLHRAIERHGALVAAEDDWWGSRAAGNDISTEGDPIEAIFLKYYEDAPSPRVFPAALADEWFHATVPDVHGVIFYLPPEDDVFGWDYPRQKRALNEQGIPHMMIRDDASMGDLSPQCHDQIEDFVVRLGRE